MAQSEDAITILLVEDDDVDVMSIQRTLKKHRIANTLVRAKHGKEAMDFLEKDIVKKPYIILLDINMPVMNGIEFLETIRSHKTLHDSTIFVLTTSSADEDITKAYNQHIAGYFLKCETGSSVTNVVNVLGGYWKIVHLPK
ncbi:response regulator [Teredinibacter franksiae]|uniref:response regulator n=1 Tax=Teredinibacter franksiae TaxID=2761453 RepID=UPI00162A30FC|nr:response regulator [Teredinibacter franksiae]